MAKDFPVKIVRRKSDNKTFVIFGSGKAKQYRYLNPQEKKLAKAIVGVAGAGTLATISAPVILGAGLVSSLEIGGVTGVVAGISRKLGFK